MENITNDLINMVYDNLEGFEDLAEYHNRHETLSLLILTQHSPKIAIESARLLESEIKDKIVVEIGAGVGYLAIEMAKKASHVWAIEVDPAWSWIFTKALYRHKPVNLTWIFDTAESVADIIKADVAIIFTNSGIENMKNIASRMAPRVIMPMKRI